MRAIILAAGKGERLRGVVDTIPKPMVRIDGKPILQHNIEWLKRYDITDIYINVHHLQDAITGYFGDGAAFGVSITYSYEESLLGTAGAVRRIIDHFWTDISACDASACNEPFLVIYGDNLHNYDLPKIITFHKRHKGIGTVAFHRLDDVSQSGIAIIDGDGRILRFIEKPKPDECVSTLVNTGLYVLHEGILKYIPPGRVIDFARDIFPDLLKNGEALYGTEVQGDLTAIDTPELLRAANPAP